VFSIDPEGMKKKCKKKVFIIMETINAETTMIGT